MCNIKIQIVFASPDRQFLVNKKLKIGSSIKDAIIQSGILLFCNDIDLSKNKVGIYSKLAKLSDIVSDGDRVEIYHPLLADPKKIRRQRVKNAKQKHE